MTNPIPLANPLTCPHCYSIDLYCDHHNERHTFNEFPHSYMGKTYKDVAKQAKKIGWLLHPMFATATCPKCVKDLKN